ncbi:MAG TPA: hypothetical protein VKP30_08605 [Polyangiaceae bacterium]|nr:hypothetical protein [Polyangiaceae bacterium]
MARSTITPVTPIGGVGAMWLMAQSAGVYISVHHRGRDGFGRGRGDGLSGLQRLATMTGGTSSSTRVARFALLDELVTRQARNFTHPMLVHLHLVVTRTARARINGRLMPTQDMTLVAGQLRLCCHVVLMTDGSCRFRISMLIEMARFAAGQVHLTVVGRLGAAWQKQQSHPGPELIPMTADAIQLGMGMSSQLTSRCAMAGQAKCRSASNTPMYVSGGCR